MGKHSFVTLIDLLWSLMSKLITLHVLLYNTNENMRNKNIEIEKLCSLIFVYILFDILRWDWTDVLQSWLENSFNTSAYVWPWEYAPIEHQKWRNNFNAIFCSTKCIRESDINFISFSKLWSVRERTNASWLHQRPHLQQQIIIIHQLFEIISSYFWIINDNKSCK